MRAIHRLQFEAPPSAWSLYSRLAWGRKPAWLPDGAEVPHIEALLPRVRVSADHLSAYSAVCGVREQAHVPIAYPHMLAAPLHLAILGAEAFPVRALGLIHLRNEIVQRRPLPIHDEGSMRVWVAGHRDADKGQEFDFRSEWQVDGEVVWEETSVYLARRRTKSVSNRDAAQRGNRSAKADDEQGDPEGPSKSTSFRIPPDTGRRYARVSGGYNPIHLTKTSARMFGFSGAIAHGMWSLARCAAELDQELLSVPCQLSVSFKQPIFLPTWVLLQHWRRVDGCGLSLRDAHADRLHLLGRLTRLDHAPSG